MNESQRTVDVSVIVPVVERPGALAELYREHAAAIQASGRSAEFIFTVHPYFREIIEPVLALEARGEPLRVIETARSVGETALLRLALPACRGRVIVTLPAYRQVEAYGVTALLDAIDGGAEFAVARRWPRRDAWINRLQHWLLHAMAGRLGSNRLHDIACGVRAARREVLEEIPLYGDFSRFLPLLAMHNGYAVSEIPVAQHPEDRRRRIYGPGVYLRRLIDVLGLFFLLRFTEKPLRFFGLIGSAVAGSGVVLLLVLLIQRLAGQAIGARPLLLLAVLLTTLGVQAIALGLIGEMIVHFSAPGRRRYRIRARVLPAEAAVEAGAEPLTPTTDVETAVRR